MNKLLTCIGEILIDFLPLTANGTTTGFSMHPGGGPFNVAVGLARLEEPVAFAGKVSRDFFGRYLRTYVEAQGIDARFLLTSDAAPSTLAFVAMEAGEPVFTFYGEGTADALLRLEELPAALFEETAILHFGGISLLRGTTPGAVLTTVERLKGQALLSFDPNMRPKLIHEERSYRNVLQSFFRLADLVKISAADIAWLAPGQPVEQVAVDLLDQGAAMVIVTRGSAGVLALRTASAGEPERWEVPPVQVRVADTVGAGDAFSAGLLAALSRQGVSSRADLLKLPAAAVAEALHFAATVAALTCSRTGANPPTSAEVAQFIGKS
ncbi:MAG: carbohydrate kinase family protein [Chloroflexaceae bacterium]